MTWNPDLKAACIESHGWADTGQGKAALEAVIRALRAHRGSRCLVDARHTKVKLHSWLPRALGAGLKLTAVVQPASGVGAPRVDDMARAADNQVAIRYFSTVENAARWLTAPPATRA